MTRLNNALGDCQFPNQDEIPTNPATSLLTISGKILHLFKAGIVTLLLSPPLSPAPLHEYQEKR